MRRSMVIALVALVSLSAVGFAAGQSGTAGTPEGPYELSVSHWFGQPSLAAAVEDAAKAYEEKYPTATVKVEHIPYETYWQKIPAMAVAKQLPDVVQIASINEVSVADDYSTIRRSRRRSSAALSART